MSTLRIGMVALLVCEVLLLSAIVMYPAFNHPKYLKDAYRARGDTPSDEDRAVVTAAWARKHKEEKRFVIVGLGLMAILAVPLWVSIARAGSLSGALWRTPDQPPRLS